MAVNYRPVTHCLFDMDGLILDTEERYTKAFNRILNKYDKNLTLEFKSTVMGLHIIDSLQKMIKHFDLPLTAEEFYTQLQPHYTELFAESQMMSGAERLLKHLRKNNIPIALATSSSKTSYELKTKLVKPMFELFHHRVLGGSDPDVKQGKPAPDIFLVAARRFDENPDPSKCLVFEDAPNGVQAAVSAGMQVVMVPDPNLPKALTEKATLVLQSLEDFKPEMFGLPPFTD